VTARTIPQVLQETARVYGDRPALRQPVPPKAPVTEYTYHTCSWNQYLHAAEEIAAGLRSLDIGRGDVVALDSETRLEFYLADLGVMTNGSIAAAMYPSYPPHDLLHTLEACRARAVFVEDAATYKALREAPVDHWILLTGGAPGALTLDQLRARGRAAMAADPALLPRIHDEVRPSDHAILYLTSGATGEPKMALVTHQAIVANLDMGPSVLPLGPDDSTVAFLPSAHIAQRVAIELLPLRCGMPVTFAESLIKLPQDIRRVKPTILLAPPRMWERIYSTICTELRKRPAPARQAFYSGLGLALAAARYRRQGKTVPWHIRAPLRLADRLLFQKIRARFGGRIRVAVSGAAPLGKELAEFYEAVGMPLIEGYGLTEGGVATFNPVDAPRPGSIGKLLPGVEARIADDGELLLRTPCLFREYWNDPQATREVLRDGWLHTGDIAQIDDQGYLFITGRKKELIVSSTGKKIYPTRVEMLFKMEPLISHVLLIGDRLPFLTALFTINPAAAQLLKDADAVSAEIHRAVGRINKQLAPFEQIRKYRILPRELTIEDGELTATMKVRRARVIANFREQIAELYAGRE